MNFQQLQSRAAFIASYEGWTDISPAPEWPALVNNAYLDWCWDTECVRGEATFSTVVDQAEYDLSDTLVSSLTGPWKTFSNVWYDTASAQKPLVWSSERAENQANPKWRFYPSGVPDRFAMGETNILRLFPPPSAVKTCIARGVRLPPELVLPTASPVVPAIGVFHEAIAVRAAWYLGKIYNPSKAMGMLAEYNQNVGEYRQHLLVHRGRSAVRVNVPFIRQRVEI